MKKLAINKKNFLKNEFDSLIQNKTVTLIRRDRYTTFSLELYSTNDSRFYLRTEDSEAKFITDEKEYFIKLNLMELYEKIYSFRDMSKEQIEIFKSNIDNRVQSFCDRNNIKKDSLKVGLIKNEIKYLFSDPFKYYFEYASVIYQMNVKEYSYLKVLGNGVDEKGILIMTNGCDKDISPFDNLNKIYEEVLLKKFPNYYYLILLPSEKTEPKK